MEPFDPPSDSVLENLVGDLAAGLLERGWKMATAESCTGGWIAKCCTDRAGSSGWFERGLVSYSNEAKQEMLGVSPAVLESDGAVSREVALQMAGGARRVVGVDVAVAVTGIAGPDGGSAEKPVGTVWFGFSTAAATEAELMHFDGGRESIRRQAVAHALRGLAARLEP